MEIHPSAMAAWVPYFVIVSNRISGIDRRPTEAEVAAHRGLLATNNLRVENLEIFVDHIAQGARLRDKADLGIGDDGILFRVEPKIDLATIVKGIRSLAASPERLHRLFSLLQPFTDGNGRCGRALIMWQIIRRSRPETRSAAYARRADPPPFAHALRPPGLLN